MKTNLINGFSILSVPRVMAGLTTLALVLPAMAARPFTTDDAGVLARRAWKQSRIVHVGWASCAC